MDAKNRFEALSVVVFFLTLSAALAIKENINLTLLFGNYSSVVLVALSVVSYDLLYKATLWGIKKLTVLKKIYWGPLYFEGLWVYTSFRDNEEYFGIWRIEQDAFGIYIVAFGLDKDFRKRSTVQSVSGLIGTAGVYYIINERWDLRVGERVQFSRTTFVPDRAVRHLIFSYPNVVRGETVIFGGQIDGEINYDVRMVRRDDVQTEDELIAKLKTERKSAARQTPIV